LTFHESKNELFVAFRQDKIIEWSVVELNIFNTINIEIVPFLCAKTEPPHRWGTEEEVKICQRRFLTLHCDKISKDSTMFSEIQELTSLLRRLIQWNAHSWSL
jgi:hypothetical protein